MKYVVLKSKFILNNFYKAFKAYQSIDKDNSIILIKHLYPPPLPRDKTVDKYINLIINEFMKIDIICNNFSRDYFFEEIILILEYICAEFGFNLKKADFNNICENSLLKLEEEINNIIENDFDEYEVFLHISNLKLDSELKIGNVVFFPINENNEIILKLNKESINNNFFMVGEVYAKTIVHGSQEYVKRKSEFDIKLAINALKLILPAHLSNFNLDGDVAVTIKRFYLGKSNNNTITGYKYVKSYGSPRITNIILKNNAFELFFISALLKIHSPSNFENRLVTAIYWYGEAISIKTNVYNNKVINKYSSTVNNLEYFEVHPILLNLIISLETLLVFGNENKRDAVSNKVSLLISKDGYHENIKSFMKNMYDYRSKVVHAGFVYISQDELKNLIIFTNKVIFRLINLNRQYYNRLRFFNKKYS